MAGVRRSRGFCGGKHKLVHSENISLVYMRLENALTLTSIYAEGEAELQETSSEAKLHGHSLGETGSPGVVGWHASGSLRTPAGSS